YVRFAHSYVQDDVYKASCVCPAEFVSLAVKLMDFFFQAEDGIRDATVTGVQTCALPISRSFGSSGAVRQSASTASTSLSSFPSCFRASDATAPCAPVQKRHWFRREVNAANSSRSPTLHDEGPRITACVQSHIGRPKNSGR